MASYLSKSNYLLRIQCRKLLWLSIHQPELGALIDEKTQVVFDDGHIVGHYARMVFSGGILIEEDHFHTPQAVMSTHKAVSGNAPAIFEAGVVL
jgi:hypothetical protein